MLNWRDSNNLGVARLDETAVLIKERSCPKFSECISTTARAGKLVKMGLGRSTTEKS